MRRFIDKDMRALGEWCVSHGLPPWPRSVLPEFGMIEPGVACGWLYETDSDVVILEGFVTNPKATLRARHRAVDAIAGCLLEHARGTGAKRVLASFQSSGISKIAKKRHGMRSIGLHELMAREV